jgi:hypothetical protein
MTLIVQGTGDEKNIEDHAKEDEANKHLKGKHVFLSNSCSCPRTSKDNTRAIVREIRRLDPLGVHEKGEREHEVRVLQLTCDRIPRQ